MKVDMYMMLTAPGCGMGPAIAHDAQSKILTIDGIDEADVPARLGSAVEPEHDQRSRPDEARDDLSTREDPPIPRATAFRLTAFWRLVMQRGSNPTPNLQRFSASSEQPCCSSDQH